MKNIIKEIKKEMAAARKKFGKFHSMHEAYAVIKEEVEEADDEFAKLLFSTLDHTTHRYLNLARIEVIQVAAMCLLAIIENKDQSHRIRKPYLFKALVADCLAVKGFILSHIKERKTWQFIWSDSIGTELENLWTNIKGNTPESSTDLLISMAAMSTVIIAAIDTELETIEERLTSSENAVHEIDPSPTPDQGCAIAKAEPLTEDFQ